jgi:Tol biopolymer transport system component
LTLAEGQTLSHYRIVRRLGRGGMGEVYLAVDDRLGRQVALKVLGPKADEARLARFQREAATIAALKHPHISVLLDVGEEGGIRFLVMEHIEGESLARALQRGPLPWGRLAEHGRELASALRHAHEQGVLHRDVKPANIMISPSRGAVLLDFGVARWLHFRPGTDADDVPTEIATPLSETGTVIGTVHYFSPEQLADEPLDGRSDLFQLGIVLYEAAAGVHPFEGPTLVDTQHAILRGRPRPLRDVAPEVPEPFSRAVEKLLEKDPEYRYPDARALEVDLKVLLRDSTVDSALTPALRPGAPPRRWRAVGLAAGGLALAAVVGWGAWRALRPAAPPAVPARVVPFTDGAGDDSSPSFSPDGDSVVFASDRGGNDDLWVQLVAGGSPVPITRTPEAESQPAWSPDGARVAFVRQEAGGGRLAIHVMPALGGDARRIAGDAVDPAWSPDGHWIAYADLSGGWVRLARVAVDEPGEPLPITDLEEGFFHRRPAWTPDGRTIVFNRSPGGWVGEMMRVPASGGAATPLTADPAGTVNLAAAVTPDGRFVVHVSDRGGAVNLWRIPIAGGSPERITSGPGRDLTPAIAPDGRRIAFANEPLGSRILAIDPRDGSRDVLAEVTGGEAWAPALSADASAIALSRKVPGRPWEILLLPASGGAPRSVIAGIGDAFWVRFGPGDATLVFHARQGDGNRVGSVGADGSGLRWLTAEGEDATYPHMAGDGRLAYVRTREGRADVVLREPGGRERVVAAGATLPAFSPDGRRLAVARSRAYQGGVGIVDLDAGEVRWLTTSGTWPTWMPDGSSIAYADVGPDGRQAAWVVPADGGDPARLGESRWSGNYYPFSVDAATGRVITTDDAGGPATLWIAEY